MSISNGTTNEKRPRKVLVTGCAGFIGFHVCHQLFADGVHVVGWDTDSVSYPTTVIREHRLKDLLARAPSSFTYKDVNIDELARVRQAWDSDISHVCHLAARAGVRESLDDPEPYVLTNVVGHFNVMETARRHRVQHFLFASSSSVYGNDGVVPFAEGARCNQPMSLYGATKKADELMAYSYSHLYRLPTTALRFFTVYGPWGRPDMAVYDFTTKIHNGDPLTVFNFGNNRRAFTYVTDVVNGVIEALWRPPGSPLNPLDAKSDAPNAVLNIGTTEMVTTHRLIELLEMHLGKTANIVYTGPLACDMFETCADSSRLDQKIGYQPKIAIEEGIERFIKWYRSFRNMYQNGT